MSFLNSLKSDEALWRFETARFSVEFHAVEDDSNPRDHFQFPEDLEFAQKGGAAWFGAIVLVRLKDDSYNGGAIIAHDSLWGCSYGSFEEFYTSHRDRDPMNRNCSVMRKARGGNVCICHCFPGMVLEAIREARAYHA